MIYASLETERVDHPRRALGGQCQGVLGVPIGGRRKFDLTRLYGQGRSQDGDLEKVEIEVSSRVAIVGDCHRMCSSTGLAQQSPDQNVLASQVQVQSNWATRIHNNGNHCTARQQPVPK